MDQNRTSGPSGARGFELLRIAGGFRRILQTELGQEQLCACCNEPWPMDQEFFNVSPRGVSYDCRACIQERRGN
ncbi:hypothetical protein HSX11_04295 [Oxalobacteraceae bacterium]|nr:hypothetical protein [Oxalobacteraceae bacterium]